ncbi:unnamed protein product [Ostreobium quekettii]|uniref:Cupin type-2 domain-containing protein n=1 Tax=Ostreobium quekettii TaxID=121088 RepID=A0A8S1INP4_9CHLO|nr:unnamed protein product [Ostreobium quekettii]|eukprot:evm.model.scf_93.5 EVM.evm.TU.scf_93.5   scf_93:68293-72123(-)
MPCGHGMAPLVASRADRLRVRAQNNCAIKTSIVGTTVFDHGGGRKLMPLLHPIKERLPFGIALELWDAGADSPPSSALLSGNCRASDLFEVDYVLHGQGQLMCPSGNIMPLNAGDSVILPYAQAWCEATDQTGQGLAAKAGASSLLAWQMVVLRLLLPSSLLLSEEGPHDSDGIPTSAGFACEEWFDNGSRSGTLSHQEVANLLTGMQELARHANATKGHDSSVGPSGFDPRPMGNTYSDVDNTDRTPGRGRAPDEESAADEGRQDFSVGASSKELEVGNVYLKGEQKHGPGHSLAWSLPRVLEDLVSELTSLWPEHNKNRGPALSEAEVVVSRNDIPHVSKKSLKDLRAFQLPNQTNRLALVFDPTEDDVPFTFGLEIFEPSHRTNPHTHDNAHELFFILSGEGQAFCNGHHFAVGAGDTVVFPPTTVHGIDNGPFSKMYCLEMMLPNEMFAEFVKRGMPTGGLNNDDMCTLVAVGCSSV